MEDIQDNKLERQYIKALLIVEFIMKKLRLIRILAPLLLVFFAQNSFAQELLKNGRTFKLAIVIPETDFGKFNNGLGQPDSNGIIPYQHVTSYVGLGVQFGKMYFIKSLNEEETMKLGIDVTWFGFSYLNQQVNRDVPTSYSNSKIIHHITIYIEVGPSISYSLSESMAIDFAFKLTPTIGFIGGGDTKQPKPLEGENWRMGTGYGLRYTPALYFRYNKFLIGAEYSLGNLSFNYNIQNYGRTYPSEYESGTSPYSTLRIVLGKKF